MLGTNEILARKHDNAKSNKGTLRPLTWVNSPQFLVFYYG